MPDLGKLELIRIRGFKSIRDASLQLRPLNVLIGPNGAGKSNFISFFKLMNNLVEKNLQLFVAQQGGAEKMLFFGQKTTDAIEFYLEFMPNAYSGKLVPTTTGGLVFADEQCLFHGDKVGYQGGTKRYKLAAPGASESGLPAHPNTRTAAGHTVGYLQSWRIYHFHDTSESARVKKPVNINDFYLLRPDASNLAAFLFHIRNRPEYARIVATIQRVAPFFQDFILEPDPGDQQQIRLRWKHKGTDAYFDANDFSDGTLRFICLCTLLLQPDLPLTILIDEPELGLHPYALDILAGMLKSASLRTQLIVSTQSVTLSNQLNYDAFIIVERENNETRFRRLAEDEVKQWFDEYAVGDLWVKNLLGATP